VKELQTQLAELDRKMNDDLEELKKRYDIDSAIIANLLTKRG